MGFTIYNIFKAGILVCNGVAILHPRRFLAQYGYDQSDPMYTQGNELKNQVAGLLQAASYLKVPLIAVDCLIIAVDLIFG